MAIRNKIVRGGNGIDYTIECDSSADYPSISNNTYFKNIADNLIYYKDNTGNVLSIFSASISSINWGSITGTLSTQTDLQSALDSKIDGAGTANYISKFTDLNTLTSSLIQDNGTNVSINSAIEAFTLLTIKNSNLTTTLSSENTKSLSGTSPKNYAIIGTANCDGFASGGVSQGAIGVAGFANNNNIGSNGTAIGGYFEAQSTTANRYAIQLVDGSELIGKFLKSVTSDGRANWATITTSDISGLIDGSGTANYIPVWSDSNTLGNSLIQQQITGGFNGVGIGNAPDSNVKMFIESSDKIFPLVVNNEFNVNDTYAIIGQSYGINTSINSGIKGEAWNSSTQNIGVAGFANEVTIGNNTGGYFQAINGATNYALKLQDGTEASNKFLKSVDSLGNTNWSYINANHIYGGTTGYVLTSNGNGNAATWQASTGGSSPFIPFISPMEVFRGRTFRFDSTTVDTYGGINTLNNVSAIAVAPTSTNFGNKYSRIKYYPTIVQTGRVASIRSVELQWFITGGFRFISTWRVADTVFAAGQQNFHGLIGSIAEIPVGTASLIQVSTLTNCIFVGNDGSDTNLQVMHNDSAGTCTKIDLGINFPANRTSGSVMTTMYSVEFYNMARSSTVFYRVTNLELGAIAQGSITTNLPASTQGLAIQSARVMNAPSSNTGQWEQHKWGCSDITDVEPPNF